MLADAMGLNEKIDNDIKKAIEKRIKERQGDGMTDKPKFCKDCKWFNDSCAGFPEFCEHPKFVTQKQFDLVRGEKPSTHYFFCSDLRNGKCSPEAKYFEPKEGAG